MLAYLASGERIYDIPPQAPWTRPFWEIETVVEGQIRLCTRAGIGPLRSRTMWVFPPGHAHSWRGDGHGRPANIIVFHFESMPTPVDEWVQRQGMLELPVTGEALIRLRGLHQEAEEEWRNPGLFSTLKWQRLAVESALLIASLAHRGEADTGDSSHPAGRVQNALRLFQEHMHEGWNVEAVCKAMSVSPAHLRRLFQQIMQTSPRDVLENHRLNRAKKLMMVSGAKLEQVAIECGYQNGSVLSRAFRRAHNLSPDQWRGRARSDLSGE